MWYILKHNKYKQGVLHAALCLQRRQRSKYEPLVFSQGIKFHKIHLVASPTANRAFRICALLVYIISVDDILGCRRRAEPASPRACRLPAASARKSLVQVAAFAVKVIPSARAFLGVPSVVYKRGICCSWDLNRLDW